MDAQDIIIRPLLTEKSYQGFNNENDKKKKAGADGKLKKTYTFVVHKDANKYQIKDAVEEIFGVKVVRVNTMSVKRKTKRVRYVAGKTRSWKKAIITVAEGDSIEIFGAQA